jgi:hypothetical protein
MVEVDFEPESQQYQDMKEERLSPSEKVLSSDTPTERFTANFKHQVIKDMYIFDILQIHICNDNINNH